MRKLQGHRNVRSPACLMCLAAFLAHLAGCVTATADPTNVRDAASSMKEPVVDAAAESDKPANYQSGSERKARAASTPAQRIEENCPPQKDGTSARQVEIGIQQEIPDKASATRAPVPYTGYRCKN